MKNISCMDMGVTCPFVAEGETPEEAAMKLEQHAAVAHPEVVQKMAETMTPEEMKAAMIAKAKDATPSADVPPPTEPQAPAM